MLSVSCMKVRCRTEIEMALSVAEHYVYCSCLMYYLVFLFLSSKLFYLRNNIGTTWYFFFPLVFILNYVY
jgi:hypothetical protein